MTGKRGRAVYVVEVITKTGRACERYETYAEARRRVEQIPAESLMSIPFIFQELPDGSQRLVREEDGKPLQWHRQPEDLPAGPDEPIPLSDVPPGFLGEIIPRTYPQAEEEAIEPLGEISPEDQEAIEALARALREGRGETD
jgi:hypothetical protein